MVRIHKVVTDLTNGKIENLMHAIQIINIVFDYRYVTNKREMIKRKIKEYCKNLDLIVTETQIELMIKLMRVLYPNALKKNYVFEGYLGIREVKPTLNVNEDGYFVLALSKEPNLTFEILDYAMADNFNKIDFKNEFIVYLNEIDVNINNVNQHMEYFRRNIELVLGKQYIPLGNVLDAPIAVTDKLLKNKFEGVEVIFNGWVGDLTAVISYK